MLFKGFVWAARSDERMEEDSPLEPFCEPTCDSECATVVALPDVAVHVESLQGATADWGQAAEEESPTPDECRREARSPAPEPESRAEVVPKSYAEVAPLCAPSQDALGIALQSLEARVSDLDQALVRYGILFEQAVQRLDGQLQVITRQQAQAGKAQDDLRKTVRALVTVVGPNWVAETVQEQSAQNGGGQRHFGKQRGDTEPPPRLCEYNGPRQGDFQHHKQGDFQHHRQGSHPLPRQGEFQMQGPKQFHEESAGDGQWNVPRYRRGGGRRGNGGGR